MIINSMKHEEKKSLSELMTYIVALTMFTFAGVVCFSGALFGLPDYQQICLGIVCVIGDIFVIMIGITEYKDYRRRCHKIPSEYDNRCKTAQRSLPGKDIYDILRRARIRYTLILFVILLPSFSYLAVLLKAGYLYDAALPVMVKAVITTTVVITTVYFLVFPSSRAVRKAIEKNGVDQELLSDDMTRATHHKIRGGMILLGKKNIVIYKRRTCYIDKRINIERAAIRHEDRIVHYHRYPGNVYTKYRIYYIDLAFDGGYSCSLRTKDNTEAEIFMEKLHEL